MYQAYRERSDCAGTLSPLRLCNAAAGTCVLPEGSPPRVGDNTVPWQSAWTNVKGMRNPLMDGCHDPESHAGLWPERSRTT